MIGLGAALVSQFSWLLYLFGAFLVRHRDQDVDHCRPRARHREQPAAEVPARRHCASPSGSQGNAFFVRRADPGTGRMVRFATPLFLALCLVEFVDLVFAVDSVPAIFAITTDPFIVYTSNIFAILGLRALYFALAAMIHRFQYLKYALALVLVFIGSKIFLVGIVGKIPAVISLTVTFGLIAGGVFVSLWKTRGAARVAESDMTPPIAQRLRDAAAAPQEDGCRCGRMAQVPGARGPRHTASAAGRTVPVAGARRGTSRGSRARAR